jgi:hypothetical protein
MAKAKTLARKLLELGRLVQYVSLDWRPRQNKSVEIRLSGERQTTETDESNTGSGEVEMVLVKLP